MRLFEILLIVVVLISILFRFFSFKKLAWLHLFPLTSLLLIGYHLFFEGYRWQMLPFYLFALIFSWYGIQRIRQPEQTPRKKWTIVWLAAAVILVFLPILLPVPTFPEPDGPYDVGTTSFFWIDEEREEIYADESGVPRRVMVQVWYPASANWPDERAPYLPDGLIDAQALASSFGFPTFFLSHLSLAETNAYLDIPLAGCQETWPVLVFSHGWRGMRYQNTAQIEALAAQGYIVFAPEHAYGAVLSVYPDGEVIYNYPDALPQSVSDEEYAAAARRLGLSWVGDIRFTLDQAEKLQSGEIPSLFEGALDLEKIGFLGHSTGGGAVFEACWVDERCQAVFGEDPWYLPYDPAMLENGLQKPNVMAFSEGWWENRDMEQGEQIWENHGEDSARMVIAGTMHYDFSDMPLYSPIGAQMGLKGPIKADRGVVLLNDYLLTFFDRYLLEKDVNLLDLSTDYPEVWIEEK